MSRLHLTFDSETTAKLDFSAPADAPHQPRLVQLAALLQDDAANVIATLNVIVKPEGFEIPADVVAIHGITTERALVEGVSLRHALCTFACLATLADTHIAHNRKFDEKILRGEFRRCGSVAPQFNGYCTMMAAQDRMGGRWPKLAAAYKYFFGDGFDNAHDALADVRACSRIYFHLMSLQQPQERPALKDIPAIRGFGEASAIHAIMHAGEPLPITAAMDFKAALQSEPENFAFIYPPPPPPPPYTPPITYLQSL